VNKEPKKNKKSIVRSKTVDDPTVFSKIYKELQSSSISKTLTDSVMDKSKHSETERPKYHKFVKKSNKVSNHKYSKTFTNFEKIKLEQKSREPKPKIQIKKKELKLSKKRDSDIKIKKVNMKRSTMTPEIIRKSKTETKSIPKSDKPNRKMKSMKSSSMKKSLIRKRKISKIEGLFDKKNLKDVDFDWIVASWNLLIKTKQNLFNEDDLETPVNTFFAQIFQKKYSNFAAIFSNFNNINTEIREMMILEFWSYFVIFFFIHEEGEIEPLSISSLENVYSLLLQSIFYVGLILSKAKKSSILNIKSTALKKFNNEMKKFGFPTGVPLIKTLRQGNKVIRKKVKKILFYTSRRIRRQYEWTLNNLDLDYDKMMVYLMTSLPNEFKTRSKKIFPVYNLKKLNLKKESEYDEIPFLNLIKKKITANEFIKSALDSKKNNFQLKKKVIEDESLEMKKIKKQIISPIVKSSANKTMEIVKSSFEIKKKHVLNKSKLSASTFDNKSKPLKNLPETKKQGNISSSKRKNKKNKDSKLQKSLVSWQSKTDLSSISSKFQPLLNVSELRQNALSISRRNKKLAKKSAKKKKMSFRISGYR
jgi:hypothetical protein